MNLVKALLHFEGAAVFTATLWLYFVGFDLRWLPFALLILSPDLGAIGFVRGTRVGAVAYNLMHTYVLAVSLALSGVVAESSILLGLGLISGAHIGMDRMLGYGLKFPTGFKDTHLQRLATPSVQRDRERDSVAAANKAPAG